MEHCAAISVQERFVLCFTAPEARATARAATTAQTTAPTYARHVPERTLLYALVQALYPDFLARLEARGAALVGTNGTSGGGLGRSRS